MARRPVDPRRRQTRARRTSPPLRAEKEQSVATRSRCSSLPYRRKALALIERRERLSSSSRALGADWPMELFDGLRPVRPPAKGRRSAGLLRMSGRGHRGLDQERMRPSFPAPRPRPITVHRTTAEPAPRTWRTFMRPPAVGIGPTLQQSTRAPRASRPCRGRFPCQAKGAVGWSVRPTDAARLRCMEPGRRPVSRRTSLGRCWSA
jgi:hypothetical protein